MSMLKVGVFPGQFAAAGIPDGLSVQKDALNQALAEINVYWARLISSGNIAAPEEANSRREVLERDPGAIGCVM
jgi:hypothetical protein